MISFFEKILGSLALTLNVFNKKQSSNDSQNSFQVQGDNNRINSPDVHLKEIQPIPEISVSLYGSGAKETFEGDITNHSSQLLFLEYVDINGIKTEFNQELRKSTFVRDNKIIFPENIFTKKVREILMITRYKTTSGVIYEHKQTGLQTQRADDKYNIEFSNTKIMEVKT